MRQVNDSKLVDSSGITSIDIQNRKMYNSSGVQILDWNTGGSGLPVANYVYLVDSSTDATLMGGSTSNVYNTAQAAYTAADALTGGGVVPVVILVGKTTAADVGDITLTTTWNSLVYLQGLNKLDSAIGHIIADNASGSAYSGVITLNNISVDAISAQTTGAGPFNGPEWDLFGSNFSITSIDVSLTNAANTGDSGIVSYQSNDVGSYIGTITATCANATCNINGVYVVVASAQVDNITITGQEGVGSLTLTNVNSGGNINITQTASATTSVSLFLLGCNLNAISWSKGGGGNTFITNTRVVTFTHVNLTTSTPATVYIWNSHFHSAGSGVFDLTSTAVNYLTLTVEGSTFETIKNFPNGGRLSNCTVFNNIQSIGNNCKIIGTTITGGAAGTTAAITNGSNVTVTFDDSYYSAVSNTTVTLNKRTPTFRNLGATAKNTTTTLTATEVASGYITSTTAAGVTLTMPTATALAQALNAGAGMIFDVVFHNTGGTNTLTIAASASIAVPGTVVITGSDTLTVAPGEIGVFRIVFTSTSAAKLFRIS